MSWEAVEWALERAPMLSTDAGKKDSTARFVLVAVAEHADRSSPRPRSHPSLALLRYETGFDMKTVQRGLARLARSGVITAVGKRGDGVTEWELHTELTRPDSDRQEIEEEVRAHRERDRQRKKTVLPGRNAPEGGLGSGAQSPEFRGVTSGNQPHSGAQSPGFRGGESWKDAASGTLNPDSGAQSPEFRDAEPARTGHGTGQEPVNARGRARGDGPDPDGSLPGMLIPLPDRSQSKPSKPTPDFDAEFDQWWKIYPRRVSRTAAHRAYLKARRGQKVRAGDPTRQAVTAEQLLDAAGRFAAEMRRTNRPVDKIPHGATWLNDDRWNDYNQPARRDARAAVNGPVFEGY